MLFVSSYKKKYFIFVFFYLLVFTGIAECVQGKRILSSFYPIQLLVENVVRGVPGIETSMMVPAGNGCPHEYVVTVSDMKKISVADIFVFSGMGLEGFSKELIKRIKPEVYVFDVSKGMSALYHGENEVNPHIWVSPIRFAKMAKRLGNKLITLFPQHKDKIQENTDVFFAELSGLFYQTKEKLKHKKTSPILSYTHMFDYFFYDLGLGIPKTVEEDHEQHPSPKELVRLILSVRKSKINYMFCSPSAPGNIIDLIVEETGIKVLKLDPIISGQKGKEGEYKRIVQKNINILSESLRKEN